MTGTALERVNVVADLDTIQPDLLMEATIRFLYDLRDRLPMFAVYDHPTDFPDHYVARMWLTIPTATPVRFALTSTGLTRMRDTLAAFGLTHLERMDGDEPVILETWI